MSTLASACEYPLDFVLVLKCQPIYRVQFTPSVDTSPITKVKKHRVWIVPGWYVNYVTFEDSGHVSLAVRDILLAWIRS